jgi:dihydrodipicolinate synthase/N-acetylneuraminate lyase
MLAGCFTAIITPFKNNAVDYEGLEKLSEFQIKNGITGILAGMNIIGLLSSLRKSQKIIVSALQVQGATTQKSRWMEPSMRLRWVLMRCCW